MIDLGSKNKKSIAVLVPCLNEELTIGKVIEDFKKSLPDAEIYVCDNGSTDNTVKIALEKGAHVLREKKRGKGNAVRRLFDKVDADIYIMTDGDDTYPAQEAEKLIMPIINDEADMTVGTRLEQAEKKSFSFLHKIGNKMLRETLNICFNTRLSDILSGYRAMNREFVKTVPISSGGFEVETELTLQTLIKGFVIKEVPTTYRPRPKGSESKLKTFSDGYAILMTIISFMRDFRPMTFFPIISFLIFLTGLIPGIRVITAFIKTGRVQYISSAVLAASLMIISFFFLVTGFSIHTLNRRFNEINIMLMKHNKNSKS